MIGRQENNFYILLTGQAYVLLPYYEQTHLSLSFEDRIPSNLLESLKSDVKNKIDL